MNKTRKTILGICVFLIIALTAISIHSIYPYSTFLYISWVYGADAIGNDINFVEIWQYNLTSYELIVNFTSSGQSAEIHDSWNVRFNVSIRFNATYAVSTAQAISYTEVNMTISTIWTTPQTLNNTSCALNGNYYYLVETGDWNSTLPNAGSSYSCNATYGSYYY